MSKEQLLSTCHWLATRVGTLHMFALSNGNTVNSLLISPFYKFKKMRSTDIKSFDHGHLAG